MSGQRPHRQWCRPPAHHPAPLTFMLRWKSPPPHCACAKRTLSRRISFENRSESRSAWMIRFIGVVARKCSQKSPRGSTRLRYFNVVTSSPLRFYIMSQWSERWSCFKDTSALLLSGTCSLLSSPQTDLAEWLVHSFRNPSIEEPTQRNVNQIARKHSKHCSKILSTPQTCFTVVPIVCIREIIQSFVGQDRFTRSACRVVSGSSHHRLEHRTQCESHRTPEL